MGIVRFIVWTACAVALGVCAASVEVGGHTPIEHAKRMWRQHGTPVRLDAIGEGVSDAIDDAKDAFAKDAKPREKHSDADRDALNKLIAKRGAQK